MTNKCCYYEKDGEKKQLCTNDPECPELTGWSLTGYWGVENCTDCPETPSEVKIFERIIDTDFPAKLHNLKVNLEEILLNLPIGLGPKKLVDKIK